MNSSGYEIASINIDHSNQGYFGVISFDFESEEQFTPRKASLEVTNSMDFEQCLSELKSMMYDYINYHRDPNWRNIRKENGWI